MKAVVCVKFIKGELNPFDEAALETALSLYDDITVISMGPSSAKDPFLRLTRLGIKRAILISDSAFAGSDTLATAYTLSLAIGKIKPDIIFCGRQSIDGDTAQVGPMLATLLGYNLITNVMRISGTHCKTRADEEEIQFPALLTVERIARLRFPSIRSKVGDVEIMTKDDLGGDETRFGLDGSPTRVIKSYENTSGRRHCKFIESSELLPLIRELQKRNAEKQGITPSETPLKSIWAIGSKVLPAAKAISEEVVVIEETDPEKIAARAMVENPSVILWPANLWGRKTAPISAAILGVGLCADCTDLETDGKTLFMTRPAQGGNLYAKIISKTKPQMATVRISEASDDFLICGGRGIKKDYPEFLDFCAKLSATPCISRGLLDEGVGEYSMQVGITGKNVSPKIYIAVGVSGAVQHTAAIEGADTIIAVNPDKDARIFEYADYGILTDFETLKKNLQ